MKVQISIRLLAVILFAVTTAAKLTAEEKKILREAADEADKHIRQITPVDFASFVQSGYYLIFFGAVWCKVTQRFTPKWLDVQDAFDQKAWNKVPDFGIAKVQCAFDNEQWCVESQNLHEGYPAIMLYHDGVFVEEYTHNNEKDPIMRYLEHVYELVKAKHSTNNVHQDIIDEVEQAKEQGPARKPVHHALGSIAHLDDDMLDIDAVDEDEYQKELVSQIVQYNVSSILSDLA
ncbi:hypothetical protein HK100_010674 [Physocladia obscura]|uniref:Thioredoxin domain-containing protein n=1 Tax=Physocladia obscura TaxID=109957 RepID=A0AAD5SNT5_9FUNG|nr:hypothetical protein HK100_010674 [Physocladia obscura]